MPRVLCEREMQHLGMKMKIKALLTQKDNFIPTWLHHKDLKAKGKDLRAKVLQA